jgi:hypothetical protein
MLFHLQLTSFPQDRMSFQTKNVIWSLDRQKQLMSVSETGLGWFIQGHRSKSAQTFLDRFFPECCQTCPNQAKFDLFLFFSCLHVFPIHLQLIDPFRLSTPHPLNFIVSISLGF